MSKKITEKIIGESILSGIEICKVLSEDNSGVLKEADKQLCKEIYGVLGNLFERKLAESRSKDKRKQQKKKASVLTPILVASRHKLP